MEQPDQLIVPTVKAGTDKQYYLYIVVGSNGTGKTTFCQKMIDKTIEQSGRVLICTPHDLEWKGIKWIKSTDKDFKRFTGVRKMLMSTETVNDKLTDIIRNIKRCLIVFDDCRIYFQSLTPQVLENFFISRRQRKLNIVVVGHAFSRVPPAFFPYCTRYVIFNCVNDLITRRNHVNDYEKLYDIVEHVRKKARSLTGDPHYHEFVKV